MNIQQNIGRVVILMMTTIFFAFEAIADDSDATGQQLLTLAGKHFKKNNLWPAEITLFSHKGTVDCTPSTNDNVNLYVNGKNDTNTEDAASWSPSRKIRADRLSWLCTDSAALKLVSDDGIKITNARIVSEPGETNTLDFEKACFPVRMEGCNIEAVLRVNNAHLSCFELDGTHITQEIDAYQVTVDHDVDLGNGFKADKQVSFYLAHIGGDFGCGGGHFHDSNINDPNSFALEVLGTKIAGYAYLGGDYDGKVIFRNSSVDTDFDWFGVTNADKVIIDFSWLKVQRFKDDEKSWPKANNLNLDGFTYDVIIDTENSDNLSNRIAWLRLQPTNTFYAQPYQQLATILRARGYEDEANTVMIEKNEVQSHSTIFLSSSWWWYNIFGKSIGYGYRPMRAMWASIGFIFAGWLFFTLGFNKKFRRFEDCWATQMVVELIKNGRCNCEWGRQMLVEFIAGSNYSPDGNLFSPTDTEKAFIKEGDKPDENYPKFNAFIYSLETFVPFVKLGVGDYWQPNANKGRLLPWREKGFLTTGGLLRIYFWIHIIAGWILTTLLVGALTGLIKT
jgi:hypothetical protein